MRISGLVANSAVFLALIATASAQAVQVDEKLPAYEPVQGVSGTIKSIGSDTMNNLMALWGDGFRRFYPAAQTEVEGKGSSTAPPALIAGTANFGPMSRPMKASEIDEFEKKFGYKPTALSTSIDMLAVFVHKDNPLEGLTLPQVDAIFSKNRKGGAKDNVRTWGELGLTGEWARQPMSLYGRNSASGTYGFFKDVALFGGDYKDEVKEQPGSSAVVQGVASDKAGIGYSGIGFKTADVRAVPIQNDEGDLVEATPENAYSGAYPLARPLLLYINREPNKDLDPLRREFIRYIFSKEGQQDVIKAGFNPVTFAVAKRSLAAIGVELKEAKAVEAGSPR